jgi:protein-disulfide isomerase
MRTGADAGAPAPARSAAAAIAPPWKGGAGAKVVIEEFSDFECPFCQVGARTVEQVVKLYGPKVKLVFYHLPLTQIHPQARQAAEAAVCAQIQGKFWPMHDLLFQHNEALSRADLIRYARQLGLDVPRFIRDLDSGAGKARVEADIALGNRRAIEGVPAFFINGTKEEGAIKLERFKALVDAELRR